jgi:autotransporter-associated beta strand protein
MNQTQKQTMKHGTVIVSCMLMLLTGSAWADNAAWSRTATSGDWADGGNWIGGSAPGATVGTTSPDVAIFSNASLTRVIAPDANRNIGGFLFTNAGCGAYTNGTTTGNKLLLSDGGRIQLASNLGSNQVINAPLELQGDNGTYTFTNASAKTLTVGGAITGVSTAGNTNTLLLTGTAGGVITNAVGDGVNGGCLAVTKSGTGGWTLSGPNTYSGGMTLVSGALGVNHNYALGMGPVTVNGGKLSISRNITVSGANPYFWNGNFSVDDGGGIFSLNAGTGNVTLGATNVTITTATYAKFIVGGAISGAGKGLTVAGGYPVILNGINTFDGGIALTGQLAFGNPYGSGTGTVFLNGGGFSQQGVTVTLSNNNSQVWNGNIGFNSTGGSLFMGTGTVLLTSNRTVTVTINTFGVGGVISDGGSGYGLTYTAGSQYGNYLNLGGANTFSGGFTYNGNAGYGILQLANLAALGTGTFTIKGGDSTT